MDYGLERRRAFVVDADRPIGAACAAALRAEGAGIIETAGQRSPDVSLDDVDIVVAGVGDLPAMGLLDVASADPLHEAWHSVEMAIDVYRSAIPRMAARRWGRFVWVGSSASRSLDAAATGADEHAAVVALAMRAAGKVLASEVGQFNVTANSVLHGGDATPEDVAATVAFLCSDGAGYITGVTITVDGGAGTSMF